jgi:hypothetical protein
MNIIPMQKIMIKNMNLSKGRMNKFNQVVNERKNVSIIQIKIKIIGNRQ